VFFISEADKQSPVALRITGSFLIASSVLLLIAGKRYFERFQFVEGRASRSPDFSRWISGPGILRCTPNGSLLNLIRKEIHLLKPLWLATFWLVFGSAFCSLTAWFGRNAVSVLSSALGPAALGASVVCALLAPLLAGSLAMGEERSQGTQILNLTLPVSTPRLWFIKLFTVVSANFICTFLALSSGVIAILQSVARPPEMRQLLLSTMSYTLLAAVFATLFLSLPTFFCACGVKSPMHAMFLVFPMLIPAVASFWLGRRFGGSVTDEWGGVHIASLRTLLLLSVYGIPLILGLVRSYRLFRTQPEESAGSTARALLPFSLLGVLWGFPAGALMFLFAR
jgi:hypothetical protein